MNWVIDCSFAAALFLPDEKSNRVNNFFQKLSKTDVLYVPSLWWYEITNVLIVAERRERITYSNVLRIISLFEEFEIETDIRHGSIYSKKLYEIAKPNNLSIYDASYIELALRINGGIASLDRQLLEIIDRLGIKNYNI